MAEKTKNLNYYLGLEYPFVVKHDEDGWFAKVPDLPGCMTWADTFEELRPMVEDAKRGWIEDALEHGDPIPEPRELESYSGKVNLRMPRSLHRDLVYEAEREGVSLNQLMVSVLARSVGHLESRRAFDAWAEIAREALSYNWPIKHSDPSASHVAESAAALAESAAEHAQRVAESATDLSTGQVDEGSESAVSGEEH